MAESDDDKKVTGQEATEQIPAEQKVTKKKASKKVAKKKVTKKKVGKKKVSKKKVSKKKVTSKKSSAVAAEQKQPAAAPKPVEMKPAATPAVAAVSAASKPVSHAQLKGADFLYGVLYAILALGAILLYFMIAHLPDSSDVSASGQGAKEVVIAPEARQWPTPPPRPGQAVPARQWPTPPPMSGQGAPPRPLPADQMNFVEQTLGGNRQ